MDYKQHWENVYTRTPEEKLGWFQKNAEQSLKLIRRANLAKQEPVLDVGSGASRFIDNLLAEGYENILATDISEKALEITKNRLPEEARKKVRFITDDLTAPAKLTALPPLSLWHDRAVLHFLTEEKDRQTYKNLLDKLVLPGKFVILAAFHTTGATKCSGLPVRRYDLTMLQNFLGEEYSLSEHFHYDYVNPSGGVRPYIYALFQRRK